MVEFANSTNYTDIIKNYTENEALSEFKKIPSKRRISFTFKGFVILLIDIFMVTGPSLGYFLQSLKFKKTKSSKGFSKSICLIIYTSQILRVFFWIGKPFKITLLYQSILIICFQIYLIYLWIKYHNIQPSKKETQLNDLNYNDKKEFIEYIIDWSDTISPNKIWNWTSTIEYYKFMFLMVIILLLICGVIGIHNPYLTNIIGTISVISEASTLIPQIIVSCKTKNASNLSMSMVALWFIGDSCKFVYNIIYKTPIQMIASGGLQIFLDFFCLMQIICYKNYNHYNNAEDSNIQNPIPKSKQVQQINQFMNKLEERFSEGDVQNSKGEENENNHHNNNESNTNINKVEVVEGVENSDKIEVLDKSKSEHIQESDDEEHNNHIKIKSEDFHEETIEKDNNEDNPKLKE